MVAAEVAEGCAEYSHTFVGGNVLLFSLVIIFTVIIGQVLDKYDLRFIPHSVASMVLGFIIGGVMHAASPQEEKFVIFNENLFFFFLLPPIVYDAGYSMKRTNFFKNMYTILYFAVFGTLISTFLVGGGVYGLALAGVADVNPNPVDAFLFGALVSATDPIATLAILGNERLHCDPMLYSIVFGESVLNDAIAITLFNTIKGFREGEFNGLAVLAFLGKFIGISLGSVVIGGIFAMLSAALLRKVNFTSNPSSEFIILFFSAYAAYSVSEVAHLSGIIALFGCGIMHAHYAWYNISNTSRTTTRHAFHAFAHLAETFLYVYLGITAVLATTPAFDFAWSWKLIIWAVLLMLAGRALNIFPLSWLANKGRKVKLSMRMQVIMWFSGLRGAIAFALSLSMDSEDHTAKYYTTTTIAIVIITTLVMGGMTNYMLKVLGLSSEDTGSARPGHGHGGHDDEEMGVELTEAFVEMPGEAKTDEAISANGASAAAAAGDAGTRPRGSSKGGRGDVKAQFSRRDLHPEDAGLSERQRIEAIITRRRAAKLAKAKVETLGRFHDWWIRFDVTYMQPWFGGRYAPRIEGDDGAEDNSQMPNPYLGRNVEAVEEDAAETAAVDDVRAGNMEGTSLDDLGSNPPENPFNSASATAAK